MKASELVAQLTKTVTDNNEQIRKELETRFDKRDVDLIAQLSKQTDEALEGLKTWQDKIEQQYSLPGSGADDSKENEQISLGKAALAMRTAKADGISLKDSMEKVGEGFGYEVFKNMRERQMTTGDSSAGNFIPEQQMPDIIGPLRADVVAMALGATQIPFSSGFPVVFPRQMDDLTAKWTGEGETITDSKINTGKMTLTPRSLTAAVIATNLSIENAAAALDVLIRRSFSEQMVRALDIAALNGMGANQPTGIIQTASSNVDFSGANVTYTKAREMERELRRNNAYRGSLGWAFHPDVQFHAETAQNETGIDLNRRMFTDGALTNFLGHKFATSTNMPTPSGGATGAIIFGNWADLIIGLFKGMELRASDTAGGVFLDDSTVIRGVMRADIGFWHEKSFILGNNYGA